MLNWNFFEDAFEIVLKRKFSASQFWKDCIEHECTSFVYVGEICRFLVMQPPSAFDRLHKIRRAVGNGLRANYWEEFRDRFNVECNYEKIVKVNFNFYKFYLSRHRILWCYRRKLYNE